MNFQLRSVFSFALLDDAAGAAAAAAAATAVVVVVTVIAFGTCFSCSFVHEIEFKPLNI